ncbi:MAG: PD-(D/E)XK nuclease family protein [Promethearchaeota archaeon]
MINYKLYKENIHSNMLSWLLDPSQPHNIRSHFLNSLIQKVLDKGNKIPLSNDTLMSIQNIKKILDDVENLSLNDFHIFREEYLDLSSPPTDRIDISILYIPKTKEKSFYIGIEVKINQDESENQTKKQESSARGDSRNNRSF